jgi:hypothetical protein
VYESKAHTRINTDIANQQNRLNHHLLFKVPLSTKAFPWVGKTIFFVQCFPEFWIQNDCPCACLYNIPTPVDSLLSKRCEWCFVWGYTTLQPWCPIAFASYFFKIVRSFQAIKNLFWKSLSIYVLKLKFGFNTFYYVKSYLKLL